MSEDGLRREHWWMNVSEWGIDIRINSYARQKRQTKRHKWTNDGQMSAYNGFDNRRYWDGYGMSLDVVPWSDELHQQLADKVRQMVLSMKVVR